MAVLACTSSPSPSVSPCPLLALVMGGLLVIPAVLARLVVPVGGGLVVNVQGADGLVVDPQGAGRLVVVPGVLDRLLVVVSPCPASSSLSLWLLAVASEVCVT